jgi:hypothetical protein
LLACPSPTSSMYLLTTFLLPPSTHPLNQPTNQCNQPNQLVHIPHPPHPPSFLPPSFLPGPPAALRSLLPPLSERTETGSQRTNQSSSGQRETGGRTVFAGLRRRLKVGFTRCM